MNVLAGSSQHRISALPVLVLMPHSRCDCRCLMCDIWRVLQAHEISLGEIQRLLPDLRQLHVEWVIFSGGEPLLHSNLFPLCDVLRGAGIRVTLLSSGQRLAELAASVALRTDETILSLDGPEPVHDAIRRVKGAYARLVEGLKEVRRQAPAYPFSCRTTVQRENFFLLRQTLMAAKTVGFNSISYLAADVSSTAFNRPQGWNETKQRQVAVSREEIGLLGEEIERLIREHGVDIESGFVRESPGKLRRIVQHFRSLAGDAVPVAPQCNAPWVSAVVEADGTVRPCFFHESLGSIREESLPGILNGERALRFRETLNIDSNPVCQRCVCSLYLEPSSHGELLQAKA